MIEDCKIREIVNKIAIGFSPDKIILFGSYATGHANEDSDLDLLIVKDTDLPMHIPTVKINQRGIEVPQIGRLVCRLGMDVLKRLPK